jgi:hypothetical protein
VDTQLPIDEYEEWIWDSLDSKKDDVFEYVMIQTKNTHV